MAVLTHTILTFPFCSQAKLMADIPPHKDVVRMLGICENPACMVLEFVPKDHRAHSNLTRFPTRP